MPSLFLDELLQAIGSAITSATESLRRTQSHTSHLFFSEDHGAGATPEVLRMVLPRDHLNEGDTPEGIHEIPTATLADASQVALDTLSLDFDVIVEGLSGPPGQRGRVALSLAPEAAKRPGSARLSLIYKAKDPPEGLARLNDKLLKKF